MSTIPDDSTLEKFTTAMQSIYGQFTTVSSTDLPDWEPPEMAEGHRGRYLWTDAFGVINFLTLYKSNNNDPRFLVLANRLVHAVHATLGRTRDLKAKLPGATEAEPLKGGLRIGKKDEKGDDADGQYFHYLSVWMFALNRMTLISGDKWYNNQAISMAKSTLPKFVHPSMTSLRPRIFWKMSIDLSKPLVMSEGNLDPIDGYVTYNLLQQTSDDQSCLQEEIKTLKRMVDTKWRDYTSTDPLDLGMTLWTCHWLIDEEWASFVTQRALRHLRTLLDNGYFDRPVTRRLAFREFGTAIGLKSAETNRNVDGSELSMLPDLICRTWEKAGLVPEPKQEQTGRMAELMPITAVMYATALVLGVMNRSG